MSSKVRRRRRDKSDDLLDWVRELKPQDPIEWGGFAPYIGLYVSVAAELSPRWFYDQRDRPMSQHIALGSLAYASGAHKGAHATARYVGQRFFTQRTAYGVLRAAGVPMTSAGISGHLGGAATAGYALGIGALAAAPHLGLMAESQAQEAIKFVTFYQEDTGLIRTLTGGVGHGGYFDIVGNLSRIVNHYF